MGKFIPILAGVLMACAISRAAPAATAFENLTLNLNVPAACTITATPLNFGNYNQALLFAANTPGITVKCTNDLFYRINLNKGLNYLNAYRRMSTGTGYRLNYVLCDYSDCSSEWGGGDMAFLSPHYGTGNGDYQSITVYGAIPPGQIVPAGNYSDTVVAEVEY